MKLKLCKKKQIYAIAKNDFIVVPQAHGSRWQKMEELKQRYDLHGIQPDLWASSPAADDW